MTDILWIAAYAAEQVVGPLGSELSVLIVLTPFGPIVEVTANV